MDKMQVVESPAFAKKAGMLLGMDELENFREYIAQNPKCGVIISGTGGIRKVRWRAGGKGKRGGSRIIYFFYQVGMTVYLMACYAKNEKDDLSAQDKKQLKTIIEQIKKGKQNG